MPKTEKTVSIWLQYFIMPNYLKNRKRKPNEKLMKKRHAEATYSFAGNEENVRNKFATNLIA